MANPVPAAAAENPVCPICLEDLLPGALISVLNCDHTYHQNCFQPWLDSGHRTCPLGRERITSVNGVALAPLEAPDNDEDDLDRMFPNLRNIQISLIGGGEMALLDFYRRDPNIDI